MDKHAEQLSVDNSKGDREGLNKWLEWHISPNPVISNPHLSGKCRGLAGFEPIKFTNLPFFFLFYHPGVPMHNLVLRAACHPAASSILASHKYYIFQFFIMRKMNCEFGHSKVMMNKNKDSLKPSAAVVKKG